MRRFYLLVHYTRWHKVGLIREAVRALVSDLQKLPAVDYLLLEAHLDWEDTSDDIWVEPHHFPKTGGRQSLSAGSELGS